MIKQPKMVILFLKLRREFDGESQRKVDAKSSAQSHEKLYWNTGKTEGEK
jgi:hypothetical protein